MASSTKKSPCTACSKAAALVTCRGCLKDFCIPHVIEHRQILSKLMDEVLVDHDQLRQTIDERTKERHHHHPLMKQIDEWEQKSIEKIHQAANDARQQLTSIIEKHTSLVTEASEQCKQQLSRARADEEYFETDLEVWKKELGELRKSLATPSTINIRSEEDATQFISKLTVEVMVSIESFERRIGDIRIENMGQLTIQGPNNAYAAVRGKGEYSSEQHRFRFKLEKITSGYMFLGIISKDAPMNAQSCNTPTAYGWAGQGYVYINGVDNHTYNDYQGDMQTNDVMELIVDCNKNMIRLTNERTKSTYELKVDLNQCPFPWQLNIGPWYADDCVRILSE